MLLVAPPAAAAVTLSSSMADMSGRFNDDGSPPPAPIPPAMDVMAVAHRFFAVDDGGRSPGVVAEAGRRGWVVVVFDEGVVMGAAVDGRGVSFPNGVFLMPLPPLDDDVVVIGVETIAVVVAAVDSRGVSFPNGLVPDEIGGVDRS